MGAALCGPTGILVIAAYKVPKLALLDAYAPVR